MTEKEMKLTVAEEEPAHAGRGTVRLDESVMKKLGVRPGDIIQIKGQKTTGAVGVKGYAKDHGLEIARMDGLTRRNAGTSIGEKATISKADFKEAKSVTLAPAESGIRLLVSGESIKHNLLGRPVVKGDVITPAAPGEPIQLREDIISQFFGDIFSGMGAPFGLGEVRFVVTNTNPSGIVLITDLTDVEVLPEAVEVKEFKVPAVAYEDIGGLKEEIQRVREMIELPLKHPELFDRLGIEPPKGVLLHGPPGTGKTLIAKAVASESDAYFISVAGPELMSKFYGESEQQLREVFKEAEEHAPAIIFMDELDSLAPKREEVTGEVERRMVAQLCTLMDGLKTRGKVIVIGATNRPNALDPAIRRPGRFDREIEIGVPDRDGRKEILQIHTRGMPLAKDVDLDHYANITHGFVGADLEALAKEAAMSALRGILPKIKLEEKEAIPPEVLEKLQVTRDDFDNGLKMVEPSAMREVLVEVPNVRWEDIGGLEEAKQELKEAVEWPLKHPDSFKRMGIEPPHGILLYGPPGSGKTLLARAVATESEANFIAIKGPQLLSKWVGESEKGIRETFRKARMAAPAIVFFDEIDAIVPARGSGFGDSHVTERVISQLLTELDGLEKLENVVVLAATNRPDLIDSAVLRPGRFDRLVLVPAPDKKARLEIFKIHTRGMPLAKDVDLNVLATETEGYVGADIAALCREAAMFVLRRDIKGKEVKMADFREVMKKIKPSVTKEIEKTYEAFSGRSSKRIGEEVTKMHY
jgi:transitional endoplasmic reticulum ATPase